jgi:hypothetical protein
MKSKIVNIVFSLVKHLIAFGAVIYSWLPLAKLYLSQFPPVGADFYQYVNFTAYIQKFMAWPAASWKYIWFSGHPTFFDYGILHSYLTLPLTKFFTLTDASRFYLIGTLGLYLIFAYLLFWELSKNRLFSLALAVCITWSYNLYVGLFFGGTAGYAATQMFLPLVLYLVVKYYKTKSQRFLLLAAFFLGLYIWGHTGLTVSLVFIPTLIILFFWSDKANKFLSLKKIGDLLLFCFLALLIALFALYPTLYSIVNVSQEQASGIGFGFSSNAYPDALSIFIKSNNLYIFAALAAAFLLVFILKRLKELNEAKAFFLLALYLLAFEWLYTIGRNPIANAIGPDRTYFALSLALAGLLAALFRSLGPSFTSFSQIWKAKHKERYSLYLKIGLIGILFFGVFQISDTQELVKNKMGNSSLLPNEINDTLVNNKEVPEGTVPSWLSADDKNYRLYEINNSVNIWWNIVYNLPIVKGYFPVMPSQSAVNWLYWADQTFIGEIVKHFNTPESVAKNSALFLLDWYGVKYLDNQGEPFSVAK